MDERNWLLVAGVEIVLLFLVSALLLNRSVSKATIAAPMHDLRVIYKPVNSPGDIKPLPGPAVPPIAYTSVISFANLDVKVKKKK